MSACHAELVSASHLAKRLATLNETLKRVQGDGRMKKNKKPLSMMRRAF